MVVEQYLKLPDIHSKQCCATDVQGEDAIALISVWRLNHDLEDSTNHHAGIIYCMIINI